MKNEKKRKGYFCFGIGNFAACALLIALCFGACELGDPVRPPSNQNTPDQNTQDQYTVSFNINGGSGTTPDAQTANAGSSITLPDGLEFSRTDCVFGGWNTDADGTGTNYRAGSSYTVTGDVELYAKWVILVPGSSLAEKLAWLQTNALSNSNYILEVDADEDIDPTVLNYDPRTNIGVTLISTGEERVIGLSSIGRLFTVNDGVTLTLDNNITLQGRSDNNASLVYINSGGTLIMNAGSRITGNTFNSGSSRYGAGVYVGRGTFTMYGGEISGNIITGSLSSYRGGGVYVYGGTFRIVTGTIYGSNEAEDIRNTAPSGAALYYTAEFGIFSGETWNGKGTLNTTDDTIKVINGVLVSPDITPMPDNYEFNVGTTAEWNAALNSIATYGSNKNCTINVTADFSVEGRNYASFGSASGVTVILRGPGRILSLSGNGSILYIGNNQSVILQDLTLKGHRSNNASLVRVYGTFTMDGGEISGNNSYRGGGIDVYGGTFTMNSGEISGNTASSGGGVYVLYYSGTFTMNGGEISGNTASGTDSRQGGGGVYVGGTSTMNGGRISGNTASGTDYFQGGGGVYVNGTFTMHDGEISGNTASSGGGVYVLYYSGTFTMNGGEISGNTASGTNSRHGGGGVYTGGSITMNGGEISGNTASSYGGGVYMNNGTFRIVTGTIYGSNEAEGTKNTANNGAALYHSFEGTAEFGTFSGETWNGNGTLGATENTTRVVNGVLLGVPQMPDNHVFNVGNTAEWNAALNSIAAYGSNKNYTINVMADFSVEGRDYASFGGASGVTVTLRGTDRILSLSGNGSILYIGSDQSVILQDLTLEGHSLNNASLVTVDGTFTMHSGKISGNTSAYYGGGVYVNGTFTMHDGEISGNAASSGGGGVSVVSGTFTMHGGDISGNTSAYSGGGVYVNYGGTFTMNGGEISDNTASSPGGGGVYVGDYGTFTMHGGDISGNTSAYSGGGVMVSGGTFRIVTGTIYGSNEAEGIRNTAFYGAALYRSGGTVEFGTFSGETWNGNGILGTTNETIRVVNGALVSAGDITPMPDNHVFNVATTTQWNNALNSIAAYGSNKNYTINVTANFSVDGRNYASFGGASGITVTLRGQYILSLSGNGSILRIESNQSVILQDLSLKGHSSNNSSLVYVTGTNSALTMHDGEISGNGQGGDGGGVYVGSSATFTMHDGEISGNRSSAAAGGGGVMVSGGTFTMHGGIISDNTAPSNGGGVSVFGTFTMNGGEISGNTAGTGGGVSVFGTFRIVTGTIHGSAEAEGIRNTAPYGAALYRLSSTAEFGIFSGETWNGKGTLDTTDDTIRVVGGNRE